MITIIYPESVKVIKSYLAVRPKDIYEEMLYIYYVKDIPKVIKERTFLSIMIEWMAHNMLFFFGYKTEQTKDLDLDNEPLKHRIVYTILAFFYFIGFWKIFQLIYKNKYQFK